MTAVITRDKNETPPPNPNKDGEYHDRCPKDGCLDVDRIHKNGGTTVQKREEYLNWSMYNADPRQGGCGYSWARTTPQGVREDQAKGVNPKWGTKSAETGRAYSLPTEAFRRGYDAVDWSK